MSGGDCGEAGQQLSGTQSAGVGQPALKEKSTVESCRSKPSGGSVIPGPATRARVYVEKSPVCFRLMVSTNGSSSVPGETETTSTDSPPVTVTLSAVRVTE